MFPQKASDMSRALSCRRRWLPELLSKFEENREGPRSLCYQLSFRTPQGGNE